LIELDGSPGFN